jgi:hypothetical protein
MKKIIIIGQMRKKSCFIVIYHSSLVKAAMNAVCVCKLRKGVNKTPQFLLFSLAKSGTKTSTLVNCEGIEFLKSLDRRICDCKLRN